MSLRDILNGTSAAPAAPAAPIETAARAAAAALQPTGSPELDLANLLSAFEANAGVAPRVNPPEGVKVLATKTAAEVAGKPEPEADDGPEVEPPTTKPDSVKAAEAAPRSRRTAAVVQEELDALVQTHNKLSAAYETLKNESLTLVDQVRQEMKAENDITESDKAKAYTRAELAETTLADFQARAALVIRGLNERLAAAGGQEGASCPLPKPLEEHSSMVLAQALGKQGWTVSLTVPAA